MNLLGLGKHIFGFASSVFDVGSDIANSLSFLGVLNHNSTYNILTHHASTTATPLTPSNFTIPINATNEMILCTTTDMGEDLIWGVLSLLIVFLPGFICGKCGLFSLFRKNTGVIYSYSLFVVCLYYLWGFLSYFSGFNYS